LNRALAVVLISICLLLAGCDICWPRGGRPGVCDDPIVIPDDDDSVDDDDTVDDDDSVDDDDTVDDDDSEDDDDTMDDDDFTPDPCDMDWASPVLAEFGYQLVCLSPGVFEMGSPEDEDGRDEDELVHAVELTGSMLVGTKEVHQELFQHVTGRTPSDCKVSCEPDHPVQQVTWGEAAGFCNLLSELEGLDEVYGELDGMMTWDTSARGYRLLTESEWEYAARSGVSGGPYAGGAWDYAEVAVCFETATAVPGSLPANSWGLFDMSGNVSEWVWDWYDLYNPSDVSNPAVNPAGPATGEFRVHRGGSWRGPIPTCRVADRSSANPDDILNDRGFRIARTVP